jgi:hypothetical protein
MVTVKSVNAWTIVQRIFMNRGYEPGTIRTSDAEERTNDSEGVHERIEDELHPNDC